MVLALVWLRLGMATPSIVLGLALPSAVSRNLWWLFSGLAIAYGIAGWFYSGTRKRALNYLLLMLASIDVYITIVELHLDLRDPIAGERPILVTSIVLDVLQLVPALIVASVVTWTIRQVSRKRVAGSVRHAFTLSDGRVVETAAEDEVAD
ncbi:MAG: hypothetical protein M3Y42_03190 [Actinomycetota bacterium]|nr:hypothetical protein [Actinomycetota bacterium]MDQ2955953.1 hypothetical protein [Actinomycetota bacterium]